MTSAFNVGCYTLSVAGQVLHYRTWLFHNVKTHKTLSRAMNLSGILQVIFGILCVIGVFAKCTPVEGNWNPTVEATCWAESAFLGINYTSGPITINNQFRYIDDLELSPLSPPTESGTVDAEIYWDLSVRARIFDKVELFGGVNNVLDKTPPILSATASPIGSFGNGNTYPGIYDALGRYLFVGLTIDM